MTSHFVSHASYLTKCIFIFYQKDEFSIVFNAKSWFFFIDMTEEHI